MIGVFLMTSSDIKWSYSKINTFENCPFKFNLIYNLRKEPPSFETIESHLGRVVHSALENLYNQKLKTKEDLLIYFDQNFNDQDKINIKGDDFRSIGRELLSDYYDEVYKQDRSKTVETEYRIEDEIDDYTFVGIIDRISLLKHKVIINDYKTGKYIEDPKNLQSAIYVLLLDPVIPKNLEIETNWYYLRHKMNLKAVFTKSELEDAKKKILEKIQEIENTTEFLQNKGNLCPWCEFRNLCFEEQ